MDTSEDPLLPQAYGPVPKDRWVKDVFVELWNKIIVQGLYICIIILKKKLKITDKNQHCKRYFMKSWASFRLSNKALIVAQPYLATQQTPVCLHFKPIVFNTQMLMPTCYTN